MHSTLDSRLEIEAEAIGQAVNSFHSPFLSPKSQSPHDDHLNKNTALIILNSPIENPPSPIFTKLWEISSIRICADGGANRLYHSTRDIDNAYIPDLIRGDLDSLDPAVRQHYETLGCAVERDADQKFNDLDKALCAIRDRQNRDADLNVSDDILSPVHVYVYGAFGGRFDQEMASIQALYRWKDESMKIALYTDETCAFLLKPNVKNLILLPFHSGNIDSDDNNGDIVKVGEGPTCGLIPIGCRCDGVETEGFKWNLDGSVPLEFGGLVSTSNHAEEDTLIVRCSQPLVFTAEMVQR
jgi:thiamine pyrophosphokinase